MIEGRPTRKGQSNLSAVEAVPLTQVLPSLLGLALRQALRGERRGLALRPMRGLEHSGYAASGLRSRMGSPASLRPASPGRSAFSAWPSPRSSAACWVAPRARCRGVWRGARLGASFTLGGALRNANLLWSATIGLSSPEGEAVMMLGTLWAYLLPALLGLHQWRPVPLRRAWALALGRRA